MPKFTHEINESILVEPGAIILESADACLVYNKAGAGRALLCDCGFYFHVPRTMINRKGMLKPLEMSLMSLG